MQLQPNNSAFNMSHYYLDKFISPEILEKLESTNIPNSQNTDPIIKLLEDIKTRKIKVTIPTEQELKHQQMEHKVSTIKTGSIKINVKKNFFEIAKPMRFPQLFKNQRCPEFPTSGQKVLLQKLEKIPSYVVATKKNEMVMAMSRDIKGNNLLSWIKEKYHNAFLWTSDDGPISIGLFFMKKEDAELYLHEIVSSNPKMAEKAELAVKIVGLDAFYRLNRTAPPGQQAKLIADLEEIEQIIQKYLPRKRYVLHRGQLYNEVSYKGTPIYILKSTIIRNRKQDLEFFSYKTENQDQDPEKKKSYIFFRLEDLYYAWDKFSEENKDPSVPFPFKDLGIPYPLIEIYNLEDYLSLLEKKPAESIKKKLFISTQESLENVKLENKVKSELKTPSITKKIKKVTLEKLKDFYSFSKKILWVVTSDTLPTEKNAW